MVFPVGPRQAGKTTLGHALIASLGAGQYLNYDVLDDRAVIHSQQWDRRTPLLVLDEIQKMPLWKS
jgi:uncharacterized protein